MRRLIIDVATIILALATIIFSSSIKGWMVGSNKLVFLYIILIAVLYLPSISRSLLKRDHRIEVAVFLCSALLVIFKMSVSQYYLKDVFGFIIYPLLLVLIFEQMNMRGRSILRSVVLTFFIAECVLAIIERTFRTNFFSQQLLEEMLEYYNTEAVFSFRSTAFLGHSLRNAFIVATGMGFIALDKTIRLEWRILLVLLGFLAQLCFNGRAAIIIVSLTLIPYLLIEYYNKFHFNIFTFAVSIVFLIGLWSFLTDTSWGGRLFNNEFTDGSGQARLLALSFYRYISNTELLTGGPDLYHRVAESLGTSGVENGVVCWILNYGLPFTLLLLPLMIALHLNKLKVYDRMLDRWIIMILFYGIGISNPNLAQQPGWSYWVLFYFAFSPGSYVPRPKLSAEDYLRRRYRSIAG